ncbi:hypothetical protein M513_05966, partial [Trichuris suis]
MNIYAPGSWLPSKNSALQYHFPTNIYAPCSSLPLHKTSRIITKADKGNLVVVLVRAEYLQKMTSLLSNTIYKPLLMDPTDISRKSLRSLLVSFAGETNDLKLTTIATHLKYPGYYNAPELYGLLKMHKAGVPFRPIVSTINSATSELSRYLKQIIRPLTGKEPSFIRNSKSLVNEIKEMSLNPDEILVSCKADKGNLVVVLDRAEYLQKTTSQLSNNIYKPLPMDPTDISRKSLRSLLVSFAGETNDLKLTRIARHLKYPGYYNAPELYGLLKMHKPGVPFRPIVSTIRSATSELSHYLKQIIRPLTGKEPSFIRSSKSLVNEIKEMSLNPDEILFSYDVKGLFPSIPISHTLAVLHNLLINDSLPSRTELNPFHIITLTSFCMQEGNYFQFDNKFYQQVNGAPLGSPLSPVLAEVFLESFERTVFQTVDTQIAPRLFKPYVDDVFAIMKQGREEQFLNFLNSIFPNQISFTIEEENNTLPFFDILIMRTTKGLKAKVYRKPTHTDQYIHFTSDHPKS